jgi:hypothetical protein
MPPVEHPFAEAVHGDQPQDRHGSVAGTWLEPLVAGFREELCRLGLEKVEPAFELADEWGVPEEGPFYIGIPDYLARPDRIAEHAARTGFVEGGTPAEFLRYLRHEMGHVVNYAYRLFEADGWSGHCGDYHTPYPEYYRPDPFNRRFVVHLPGWYAQKHPDEDWAETFAVWMTPGLDWRQTYADHPQALAKLEFCDRLMRDRRGRGPVAPPAAAETIAVDAGSPLVEEGREELSALVPEPIPDLDELLLAVFPGDGGAGNRRPAADLLRRLATELPMPVFKWTGHFPERTGPLLMHLIERAELLHLGYPTEQEESLRLEVTALVTALALNHVLRGAYESD